MFKLKPVYNYLGLNEPLLDARASARCGGITITGGEESNLPSNIGEPVTMLPGTDRTQPLVARVSATRAIIFYRNIVNAIKLSYVLVTSGGTDGLTLTQTLEADLLSTFGSEIVGYAVTGLSDNKFIIFYKTSTAADTYACIGNVSGDTVTFTSPVSIGTTHDCDFSTSMFTVGKISASKVIFGSIQNSSTKAQVQVINIDGSDNITFGTIYQTAHTGCLSPKLSICSSTLGMLATKHDTTTNSIEPTVKVISFGISGNTLTFNTVAQYLNSTQYPTIAAQSNRRFYLQGIAPISATASLVTGYAGLWYPPYPGGAINIGFGTFKVTDSAGTLTPGGALIDVDTRPTGQFPYYNDPWSCVIRHNSKVVALYNTITPYPDKMMFMVYDYSGAVPALSEFYAGLGSVLYAPSIVSLEAASNLMIAAYSLRTGGTYTIKMAGAIVA